MEAIQAFIRKGFLPFEFGEIVHVDSHPDMMLPNRALDWESVEEVYEYMESSIGGIAEWLLPLVYLKHCKRLCWIRPPWSDQLRDAVNTQMKIGQMNEGGLIKLKGTNEAYFVEENLVVASSTGLINESDFCLTVCMVDGMLKQATTPHAVVVEEDWVLDICLDYFVLQN